MIKAAIFDLDGTLMDSEGLWVEAVTQYLNDRGRAIGGEEGQAIVYGRSWSDIYNDIVARHPELDVTIEEMEEAVRVYMLALREGRDVIIAESVNLLKQLADDMPVCIVSGSPCADVEAAIDLMGIRDRVAFSIGAEEYGPGKPDPTCFLMASKRLGVEAGQCVVFEDSSAGVQGANSAGMFCVALARQGFPKQDVSEADVVLADLGDFNMAALNV